MELNNLKYLIDNLSSLCGIPSRIYKNNKKIYYSSFISFPIDPITLDELELLKHKEHVGYYINESFFNYGILNYNDYSIIIGPFRHHLPSNQELFKLAFSLDVSKEQTQEFISSMKMIITMPISTVIQSLCMINFILNNEKLTLSDIIINENEIQENFDEYANDTNLNLDKDNYNNANSSYIIEKEIERIVEHGEIDELKNLFKNAPSVRPGILSTDTIRQYKNIFIVITTLTSRAAIRGGMSTVEAFKLSDLYIQKMDLMSTIKDIQTLQVNMITDYTNFVAKIKGKKEISELLISLNKYIIDNISEAIKIPDICKSLYISKSTLFDHVKKETGLTVSNYILQMKINESKSILKYTSKNFAVISNYLGFSSQSHFNRVFKKITGETPLEYKQRHKH